jgi:hypothetical protein
LGNRSDRFYLDSREEHSPRETTENPQIEVVSEGLLDQDHQAKRRKVLIRDIQQDPSKKHFQNFPTEKPRKGSKITKKGKREEHNQGLRNHAESSIHAMKGSYKV